VASILFYVPIPPPDRRNYIPFHQGAAQLAAVLQRHGQSVHLRLPWALSAHKVKEDIERLRPDTLFLSLASTQARALRPIAQAALHYSVPLLVGGPHATFAPHEVLSVQGVTAICRGEGEQVVLAFLQGRDNFPGLVRPGEPLSMARPVDLSRIPLPDRRLFATCPDFVLQRTLVGHEFMTSRGCPFRCSYCTNAALCDSPGAPRVRRRDPETVVREVQEALSIDPDVSILGFHDDVFTLDLSYLERFCSLFRERIARPFWVNAHPEVLDRRRVELLAQAGCRRIHMGVETGSEELRYSVLNRAVSDETILRAAALIKRAGIRLVTFVMLGIPGESEATYAQTVNLLRKLRPDWIIQSYFQPLPGTPLGEQVRSKLPVTSWEELLPESFYDEPVRSWADGLSAGRLVEMGRRLIENVYSDM